MKYLFLDASNMNDTFAQIGDEKEFISKTFRTNRDFAAQITNICDEMLNKRKLDFSDIDSLVLGTGPGSLTGLRVAAAFMRTLAMIKNCEITGINIFLWAANTLACQGLNGRVILVMPTLIDKAFLVEADLDKLELSEPALIERNEMPTEGIPAFGINFSNDFIKPVVPSDMALHDLAVNKKSMAVSAKGLPDLLNVLPMYVIPSQAERKFKFNGGDKQ